MALHFGRSSIDREDLETLRPQLLDPVLWQDVLNEFARATKLAVMLVDDGGRPVGPCFNPQPFWSLAARGAETQPADACPFCLAPERACTATPDACGSGITFTRDGAGLVHAAVPIHLGETCVAVVLAGQVFDSLPQQRLVDDLARRISQPPQLLWAAAGRQAPIDRGVIEAYADLLATLCESYLRATYGGIVERRRSAEILALHADLAEREQMAEELREADRRKNEFLATLAHELRNPLAPILSAVYLLRPGGRESRPAEPLLATLERQVRHMVRLVDDLLDVSRISNGLVSLRRERVSLSDVVAAAIETSGPDVEQARHDLIVELPPEPLYVEADPVRINQVIADLLNNASRYMDPGGRIRVAVQQEGNEAVVLIEDSGVGITGDLLPHVFEMFVRGPDAGVVAAGGLGVGLTLARSLVELHGGTLEARSEGSNHGSQFVVRLPLAGGVSEQPPLTQGSLEEPGGETPEGRRPGILVVEDNDDSRELLSYALTHKGYDTRTARDAPSALAMVSDWSPDVILLDIGLPGMSGHELARRLRERAALRDVVLVALTGWGQQRDRERSAAAGIDYHLTKPVEPDTLDRLLGDLLRQKKVR